MKPRPRFVALIVRDPYDPRPHAPAQDTLYGKAHRSARQAAREVWKAYRAQYRGTPWLSVVVYDRATGKAHSVAQCLARLHADTICQGAA